MYSFVFYSPLLICLSCCCMSCISPTRRNQHAGTPGGWRKKKKLNSRYRYGKIISGANPNTDRRRKSLPRKPGPRRTHRNPSDLLLRCEESCQTMPAVSGYAVCVDARIVAAIQKRSESDR